MRGRGVKPFDFLSPLFKVLYRKIRRNVGKARAMLRSACACVCIISIFPPRAHITLLNISFRINFPLQLLTISSEINFFVLIDYIVYELLFGI